MTDANRLSWRDIGIAMGINGAIAVVCFIIFSVFRSKNFTRRFFAPKLFDEKQKIKPSRLPQTFWGWIWPVLTYPEDEVVDITGLDLAVYLRILDFGVKVTLSLAVICIAVLLPLHLTDDGLESANQDINTFNQKVARVNNGTTDTSLIMKMDCEWVNKTERKLLPMEDIDRTFMTNLYKTTPDRSNHKLWAHIIMVYVVLGIVMYWLNKFSLEITNLRVKFLGVPRERTAATHTALITDIPGVKAGTVVHTINKAMNSTVLAAAPQSVKDKVNDGLEKAASLGAKGVSGTMGKAVSLLDNGADDLEDITKMTREERALHEALADPWVSAEEYLTQGGDFRGLVSSTMETVFGADKVVAVNPVYNESELQPLVAKYDRVKGQLEDLVDDYLGKIKQSRDPAAIKPKEMTVMGPMYGAWGIERYGSTKRTKVDTLDFLCDYMDECKRLVREKEAPALNDPTCSAFVTFRDRVTQTAASTSLICQSESAWRGQAAPGPEEVIWTSLSRRFWERNIRNLLMWALFILMLLTFTIVCAFLQRFIDPPEGAVADALKPIKELPVVGAIVQGILPSLVLLIFLAILPMVLAVMERFAGAMSASQVDFGVVVKFYWFQFFTVFIGAVVGGALLKSVQKVIDDPDYALELIEQVFNDIPTTASFFINFIMLQGLAKRPINLLRVVGLVIFLLFSKIAATQRARTRLWANQTTLMGTAVADHTLVLLLCITFSILSPVICAFGFLYFIITSMTERYQMIYVFRLPYESGGRMWQPVFNQIMISLYTFLVTTTALLVTKRFQFTPLVIPAYIFVLLFHTQTLKLFARPWTVISLRSAALLDNLEKETGMAGVTPDELEVVRATYLSPVFKVKDEKHLHLLEEAQRVKAYLGGQLQYSDMMLDDEDLVDEAHH